MTTKGEYLWFLPTGPHGGQIMYLYLCWQCSRKFKSTSPEESEPVMCHDCYSGAGDKRDKAKARAKRRRKRKGDDT